MNVWLGFLLRFQEVVLIRLLTIYLLSTSVASRLDYESPRRF